MDRSEAFTAVVGQPSLVPKDGVVTVISDITVAVHGGEDLLFVVQKGSQKLIARPTESHGGRWSHLLHPVSTNHALRIAFAVSHGDSYLISVETLRDHHPRVSETTGKS